MSAFAGGGPHGVGSSGGRGEAPPELMDPTRERDGRRIRRLFAPYRWRLATVFALIVVSSGLSMISPFLLRDALDGGVFHPRPPLLAELVAGMIAIAIATSALTVVQTYISNEV